MMALLTIARQYSANFHLPQEPCATCRIPGALLNDLSHMWPLKSTQASDEIIREAVQQMRNPLTRALGTSSLSNFSLHPVPVRVVFFFSRKNKQRRVRNSCLPSRRMVSLRTSTSAFTDRSIQMTPTLSPAVRSHDRTRKKI